MNGVSVGLADHTLRREHLAVRERAVDVFSPQARVDADRGVHALDEGVGRLGEPAAPGLLRRAQNCIPTNIWSVWATPGSPRSTYSPTFWSKLFTLNAPNGTMRP